MPTPKQKQRAYAKSLDDVIKRYDSLDHETVKRAIDLLQDLRKNISAEILSAEGFDAFRLTQLQQNIGILIDTFNIQLAGGLAQSFEQAVHLGQASVVEPLQAANVAGVFFAPSAAQVNIALDFSAELIQNISTPMRASINTQLRLATLSGESPFNVMKNITDILGVKAKDGVWGTRNRPDVVKGVAARAEAIVRTENTRMFNMATHSQQVATAQQSPDLRKVWRASGDNRTRPSHLAAHGQEQPIDKPFSVGGSQLMFPGDPAGPASETIHCRCAMHTIHPDIDTSDLPPSPLDKKVEKEKDRRKAEK